MPTPLRHSTIALAAVLAVVVAAFATPTAAAEPAALQKTTDKCWLDVINDWLDNNRVDGTYAIPCYSQATQHLASLSDVSGYSSAIDDIHRALIAAIRRDHGNGQGGGPPAGPTPNAGPTDPPKTPTSTEPESPQGDGQTDTTTTGDTRRSAGRGLGGLAGPTDATSIPLPLIILGVLAILLGLAGITAWAARRLQMRRPAPAGPNPRRR